MDSLNDIFKFSVFALLFVVAGIFIAGYGCSSCSKMSTKEIAEVPCSPVLPNGQRNIHYSNMWSSCRTKCGYDRIPTLDVKTCMCSCQ